MNTRRCIVITLGVLIVLTWGTSSHGQSTKPIGHVTAVQREVVVTHPGQLDVVVVNLAGSVLFKDTYETKAKARLKLLFEDDSLLSLGEKTALQITENIFDPTQDRRSTIIDLLNGTVRVLVGKIFTGGDSRFEIHTPTAVAAARGTYFIVWSVTEGGDDPTGIVNIGESGVVEVSNIDPAIEGSVELRQKNRYTIVEQGKLPTPPAMIEPGLLGRLLTSTEVKDQTSDDVPIGLEAPGSDVSAEEVTPLAPQQVTSGVEIATDSPEAIFSTMPDFPQQPPLTTPVDVTIDF